MVVRGREGGLGGGGWMAVARGCTRWDVDK